MHPSTGRSTHRFSRRTRVVGLTALAAAALLGVGAAQLAGPQAAQIDLADSVPPAVQWVGPRSNITTPGYHRITDLKSWTALWESHRGDLAEHAHQGWIMPPVIDFERHMVIARFSGESTHNNGELAQSVSRRTDPTGQRSDTLVLRYDSITFQTASFGGPGDNPTPAVIASTPYGIWVVDRFDGPVIIEEDRNGLIRGDPVWKQAHRFPALPAG